MVVVSLIVHTMFVQVMLLLEENSLLCYEGELL